MPSPFRIRDRLKKALGLKSPDAAKAADQPRVHLVVVDSQGREQETDAPIGQTVLLSAGNLARPIASGCSDSSCSTCRIEVLEGDDLLNPKAAHEATTLRANQRPDHLRLACLATVTRPGTLKVRAHELLE